MCGGTQVFNIGDVTFNITCGGGKQQVAINIKPGSDPNSINTCTGGTTPILIFGANDLDVEKIDPNSLILASATVKTVGKSNKILCSVEDSGSIDETLFDSLGAPDGLPDLTCHFITVELASLTDASTSADLTGAGCDVGIVLPTCTETDQGFFEIAGSDAVNIVKDCN